MWPPASSATRIPPTPCRPLALALRCPRGRLQLAHAAAKSVDTCADHARAETLLALLTGAGADRGFGSPRGTSSSGAVAQEKSRRATEAADRQVAEALGPASDAELARLQAHFERSCGRPLARVLAERLKSRKDEPLAVALERLLAHNSNAAPPAAATR